MAKYKREPMKGHCCKEIYYESREECKEKIKNGIGN